MNIFDSDPDHQPPFLSWGFRPFFLLAGLYTVASMSAWLAWLTVGGIVGAPGFDAFAIAPQAWHAHEMIFGYSAAALGGFFLTAAPSWTGGKSAPHRFIATVAGLWLLAAACFARSSVRVYNWLLNHAHFGPSLREWRHHRSIPWRAKVTAVTLSASSFAFSVVFLLDSWPARAALAVTGAALCTGVR